MPRTPARTSHWPLDALLDHHVTHSVVVTALIFPLPRSVRPPQVCLLAAMPTLWTSSAGPRMWGADPKGPFSGEDSLPPLISLGWDRERPGWRRRFASGCSGRKRCAALSKCVASSTVGQWGLTRRIRPRASQARVKCIKTR